MGRGAFNEFAQHARGQKENNTIPLVIASVGAPVQQVSRVFAYQSYFDDTLLAQALLAQRPNEPIVSSTMKEEQIPGYGIALHPSSQTPVAVQFKIGSGMPSSSQAIILRPGQVVRPHGLPSGKQDGAFAGFAWGLPFGWLGGGLATLVVLQSPDARVEWASDHNEIVFHRTRMQIVSPAEIPSAAPKNWPLRFPWTQATQGSQSIIQKGAGAVGVAPTRVLARLRLTTLAGAADMRILFHETNDFDLDSAGAVVATPAGFVDVAWGAFAAAGGAGDLATHYPIRELPSEIARLAADDGGIVLADLSAGALTDAYVDIVRYGRL